MQRKYGVKALGSRKVIDRLQNKEKIVGYLTKGIKNIAEVGNAFVDETLSKYNT